ncbi:hypothetical protein E1J38_005080 [Seonamhaeicola sediminis]|uniref:Uncharacterized protein n=1 Tax=Seonamhaeicola sediminis TaxID=2528206 RepID=A0A562YFY4_9FLAO|nr:hypothetical protein [Seonamhaeicola sediminis]TWO33271.1 hypothetical protein E1J38_005080 [Seonamhaeicola sediminis]
MKTMTIHLSTVILCLTLLLCFKVNSQEETKKVKIYKIWVELTDKTKQKGFLYAVDDTSLKIVSKKSLKDLNEITTINAKDIYEVYIKRRGKVWRSALTGMLGIAVVVELMMVSGDGGSLVSNEAAAVAIGVALGAPIGALLGIRRKEFIINGYESVFKAKYEELNRYAMVKQSE